MLASREEEDLQRMMNGFNRTIKSYEIEIKTNKTKIMREEEKPVKITIDREEIEQVSSGGFRGDKFSHGPHPIWLLALDPSNEEIRERYWKTY